MENKDVIKFKNYCDKFLDYVIKYSNKEQLRINEERVACKFGIISENRFDQLKIARQQTILTYNNLAHSFKKVSESINLKNNEFKQLNKLLKTMILSCKNSMY